MQTANSKQTAAPAAAPKRTSSERSPSAPGKDGDKRSKSQEREPKPAEGGNLGGKFDGVADETEKPTEKGLTTHGNLVFKYKEDVPKEERLPLDFGTIFTQVVAVCNLDDDLNVGLTPELGVDMGKNAKGPMIVGFFSFEDVMNGEVTFKPPGDKEFQLLVEAKRRTYERSPYRDELCVYTQLRRAWEEDVRALGMERARRTPIFRHKRQGGAEDAYRTRDVARMVKWVAEAAGEEPDDFTAHSARIGGATDYRDLRGIEEGKRLLQVLGRWRSDDIAFLYTRQSAEEALHAADEVVGVSTNDLESLFEDFVQS